jgi:predicted kinase
MSNSKAKQAYRTARAMVRANGNYALRWLTGNDLRAMYALMKQKDDLLDMRVQARRAGEHPDNAIIYTAPQAVWERWQDWKRAKQFS